MSVNPESLNRYAYALNNPTTNIDPSGLDCQGATTAPPWNGTLLPGSVQATSSAPCPPDLSGLMSLISGLYGDDVAIATALWGDYMTFTTPPYINYYGGGGGGSVAPPAPPKPAPTTISTAPPKWSPPPDTRPSCFSVFLNGLSSKPSPVAETTEQGAKAASTFATELAWVYGASKTLSVPLRSPYFRLWTNAGEFLGGVAEIAPILFAAKDLVPAEYHSAKANFSGACQNNFW